MLVQIGYKEIDVSFPSSSDTEFEFTRELVETPKAVPDDVWLQVLSPCRKELIRRTVDSVTGANKAIISLYIATSENFRRTVFGLSQQEVLELAVDCVTYAKSITKDDPRQRETTWNLMFSPETFTDTQVEYSIRVCDAVRRAWEPSEKVPMILNLPATVEVSTPNVFADQVEMFSRAFPQNEVCVSLHPHNDRGCAVAAAEMGQLAGATRVEGCLFGNGERTGNVDLVTLALNLKSVGIDPGIDFSNMRNIKKIVEDCTQIPIHPRAPYAGDLISREVEKPQQDIVERCVQQLKNVPHQDQRMWKTPCFLFG